MATEFKIKDRFSGAVIFKAELSAEFDNKSYSVKLGAAVKLAVKARANLSGANLSLANLSLANLSRANLSGAYLSDANLSRAYLSGANLSGANLSDANLSDANLSGANFSGAYLSRAYRSGASKISDDEIPVIPNIDVSILAAIEAGGTLDMGSWHGSENHWCGTTHCRAAWAIHLAGEKGKALQDKVGPHIAGAMIYRASRPGKPTPWFFDSTENALADIRKCAAEQRGEEEATQS